jgi:hypothetical protein
MKIPSSLEDLFTIAVALDSTPNTSNTIYLLGRAVYIVNFDNTIMICAYLRKSEPEFEKSLSFQANDYDSSNFYEKDGKIVFEMVSSGGEYVRRKMCGSTELTPQMVKDIFAYYAKNKRPSVKYTFTKDISSVVDSSLSHIEFKGQAGQSLKIIQRNIYTGELLETEPRSRGLMTAATLKSSIEPMAMKTKDFLSLFSFTDKVEMYFPVEGEDYPLLVKMSTRTRTMLGVIAPCLYNEIIEMKSYLPEGGLDVGRKVKKSRSG